MNSTKPTKSYVLRKENTDVHYYAGDVNKFIFVVDDTVPVVRIYRYHNGTEFPYPCVLEDKDLKYVIQIDHGCPILIETARCAWKLLHNHGFVMEKEYEIA